MKELEGPEWKSNFLPLNLNWYMAVWNELSDYLDVWEVFIPEET